MRKRFISVCIVVILVFSICGCAQTGENTLVAETETEINELIEEEFCEGGTNQDKEITEEKEETPQNNGVQQAEDDESVEPIYIIEPGLTQDDTYEMQDWQQAYAKYAEELEAEYQNDKWLNDIDIAYSLIYVDEDDIPEIVIYASFSMYHILTFHNGEIDELKTDRTTVCYMEKQNLIDNYSGAMGFYHDYIYSIENGKWVYVTGGEYYDKYDDEQWAYDFTYRWEDEEVTEAVYEQKLKEVFDTEQAVEPENFVSLEEMLSLFQM